MRLFYFGVCFFMLFGISAKSQNTIGVGSLHLSEGHIWAHSKNISYVKGNTFSAEFRVYLNPKSDAFWQNTYHATDFGFALSFIHTSNKFIGSIGGISMFIEPMIFKTRHLRFYPHLGIGLGFAPDYYSEDTNNFMHQNTVICSPVNAYFHGSLNLDYKINDRLQLGTFVSLQHASNGSLRMSNYGLNVVSLGVNVRYLFVPKIAHVNTLSKEFAIYEHRLRPYLSAGFAMRHAGRDSKVYYKNYMMDLGVTKNVTSRNRLGAEFCFLDRQGSTDELHENLEYTQFFGFTIGHELVIRRLGIVTNLGYFFANTRDYENYLFAKIGLKYSFTRNFFGSILLINKTTAADYVLFSLGYSL